MYFLIGIWGGPRREYAAIKFFLYTYTLAGSVFMLLAIIGVALDAGTFDILLIAERSPFATNVLLQSLAFLGFFLGFAIKVPMWPFHTWLPDAHVEAPTAGSIILAGVLLKLGTYGFVRIMMPFFPDAFRTFAIPIAFLAFTSIVYGALVAMAQWDFKKLIAYSSVNHMGYVMLGIAAAMAASNADLAARATAVDGAVLQMFNHGIITAAFFLWKVIQMILLGSPNERWRDLPDLTAPEVLALAPLAFLMVLVGIYPAPFVRVITVTSTTVLSTILGM